MRENGCRQGLTGMGYEEIKLLKQSGKSTVSLVKEEGGETAL